MEEIERMKELVEKLDKDFKELKDKLCTECQRNIEHMEETNE